jgi:hypothetical protein
MTEFLICDILERILDEIMIVGGDEYDQHSFLATCRQFYNDSKGWQVRNFGLKFAGNKSILPPYIVKISKTFEDENNAKDIKMEQDNILMALSISAYKLKSKISNVIIVVSNSDMKKYITLTKDYGLYNDDPEKSTVIFESISAKSHSSHIIDKNMKYDDSVIKEKNKGKVIITTKSNIAKWKKFYPFQADTFFIYLINNNKRYSSSNEIDIINNVFDNDNCIKIGKHTGNIKPTINVECKNAFTISDLRATILEHFEKYGERYIMANYDTHYSMYGYNNVNLYWRDDGINEGITYENIYIDKNIPIDNNTVYWKKNNIDVVVPFNNVIIIDDNFGNRWDSFFDRTFKYPREFNITRIFTNPLGTINRDIMNCSFTPLPKRVNPTEDMKQIYIIFQLFGYDLLKFGNYEKYIFSHVFKERDVEEIILNHKRMSDNVLSTDMIAIFIKLSMKFI